MHKIGEWFIVLLRGTSNTLARIRIQTGTTDFFYQVPSCKNISDAHSDNS